MKRGLLVVALFLMVAGGVGFVYLYLLRSDSFFLSLVAHILIIIPGLILFGHLYRKLRFLYDFYVPESLPFLILHASVSLQILDDQGKHAKYSKKQACKVLRNGVTGYRMTSLHTDGSIAPPKVGPHHRLVKFGQILDKTYEARILFERTYNAGEIVERIFETEFHDSFTGKNEYFRIRFIVPVKLYDIKITWPIGYKVKNIEVEEQFPVEEIVSSTITSLVVQTEGEKNYIEYSFRQPKVGTLGLISWVRDT